MSEYSIIGKPTVNVDGAAKVTGEAEYTFNMVLPNMLYGKLLRSPHPHAKIISIDTSQAEKFPGVKAIITGKDTPGSKYGLWRRFPELCDQEVLATTKVRFIGDPVAAVAAISEEIAEKALELIEVEYEPLPAVYEPMEAIKDDAPLVHDNCENNINNTRHIEWGNVDEGFKKADYIREDRFDLLAQSTACMEVHSSVASYDKGNGRLTVWSSTQSPYYLQLGLSDALKMREGDIRVIKPHVGGGFGSKNSTMPDSVNAALLSMKTGKPVRITYNREEEFATTEHRTAMKLALKIGFKKDGTIMAKEAKIITDGGAYTGLGATTLYLTGAYLTFPYNIPSYRYDGVRTYTNKVWASSVRSFGATPALYATETQMDRAAKELGIDPIEIRRKNAMKSGYEAPGQYKVATSGLPKSIDLVEARIKEKWTDMAKDETFGFTSFAYMCGGIFNWIDTPYAFSGAMIKINIDGTVDLFTQASDIGQGTNTVNVMICAEELGIGIEDIRLHPADTAITPVDLGAWASRETMMNGNAIRDAARDAKQKLIEVARMKLGENIVYDLEVRNKRIFLALRPERGYSYYDIVKDAIKLNDGEPIIGLGHYTPHGKGMVSPAFAFGSMAVRVKVDRETGQVEVKDIITAHDCGQVINPLGARGQVEGSIQLGLGWGLCEEVIFDENGMVLNPSFVDYKLIRTRDMPQIELIEVPTYEPEGPFGAKESAEGTVAPTSPAVANAIYKLFGVEFNSNVIKPEKVLKALKEKK
ncbi:MAG: xanthine dehydrogenase family protein molybdopterin-binding subunit [Dehalococcoidia bacterium]|jgi:4-hydroxybenzoyl-CoA reductase subunit alpha